MHWRMWVKQGVYCSSELYLCTRMDWAKLSERCEFYKLVVLYSNHFFLDINECTDRTDQCEIHCNNTAGSYVCYCPPDKLIANDDYRCLGE